MTCIASVVYHDNIWMGSDSAGIQGWDLRIRSDSKTFQVNDMLIGFTTSFRMGQILRFALEVPHYPYDSYTQDEIEKYMHLDLIESIRELFKSKGYSKVENNNEAGGEFLIGFRNQLWGVYDDFQIAQFYTPFQAIGSGASYAMGALHEMYDGKEWCYNNPEDIILRALKTAEAYSASVRGPFNILKLGV